MKYRLFIIDDKENICIGLKKNFEKNGYQAEYALSSKSVFHRIIKFNPHCILLDLMLGDENGIEVLKKLKKMIPSVPVIIITGFGTVVSAVDAMKYGAYDYIQKPIKYDQLYNTVKSSILNNFKSIDKKTSEDSFETRIITQNPRMLEIISRIEKIGPTNLPVLILGENGVGKENIAEKLHFHSPRKENRILKINCAAFQENLLDNELFGHERGAFTGADRQYKGVFERADNSSLFLDEIGDMSLDIQAKILRTLQNNEIRRLGGDEIIKINTRFIAATNKNIQQMMHNNTFREDLYFRLNTVIFEIPPLRERREDIPLLITHFIEISDNSISIDKEVIKLLCKYHWPGNIRELKNVIEYASAVCTDNNIKISDLPHNLYSLKNSNFNPSPIANVEYNTIFNSLRKNKFNKKRTAEELGISRKTLYNKIDKYKIPCQEKK